MLRYSILLIFTTSPLRKGWFRFSGGGDCLNYICQSLRHFSNATSLYTREAWREKSFAFYKSQSLRHAMRATSLYTREAFIEKSFAFCKSQSLRHFSNATSLYTREANKSILFILNCLTAFTQGRLGEKI